MMTTVNGYSLNPDLQLSESVNSPGVRQAVTSVLGGIRVQSLACSAGREFILSADRKSEGVAGFFTREASEYMAALRDNVTVFSVVHPSRTLPSVIIPANGINLTVHEYDETVEQQSGERMIGTIKFITMV